MPSSLLKLVRLQLGMSQRALSKRSGVPQATISRIEKGGNDCIISTLEKISRALSCDLVITPVLQDSVESIRRTQAKRVAKKHISYLKGTMHLEMQEPDDRFINELIKEEENALLHSSKSKLWEN